MRTSDLSATPHSWMTIGCFAGWISFTIFSYRRGREAKVSHVEVVSGSLIELTTGMYLTTSTILSTSTGFSTMIVSVLTRTSSRSLMIFAFFLSSLSFNSFTSNWRLRWGGTRWRFSSSLQEGLLVPELVDWCFSPAQLVDLDLGGLFVALTFKSPFIGWDLLRLQLSSDLLQFSCDLLHAHLEFWYLSFQLLCVRQHAVLLPLEPIGEKLLLLRLIDRCMHVSRCNSAVFVTSNLVIFSSNLSLSSLTMVECLISKSTRAFLALYAFVASTLLDSFNSKASASSLLIADDCCMLFLVSASIYDDNNATRFSYFNSYSRISLSYQECVHTAVLVTSSISLSLQLWAYQSCLALRDDVVLENLQLREVILFELSNSHSQLLPLPNNLVVDIADFEGWGHLVTAVTSSSFLAIILS